MEQGQGDHAVSGTASLAAAMAEALVNVAQDRWMARPDGRSDDTTVVVALLCGYGRR